VPVDLRHAPSNMRSYNNAAQSTESAGWSFRKGQLDTRPDLVYP